MSGRRITFVAPRAWPAVGGTESFLRHLTQALAERHDVRVVALSIGNEPATRLWESVRAPKAFKPFDDGGVRVQPLRLAPSRRALLSPLVAQSVPGLRRYAYGSVRKLNVALYARTVAPLIADAARGSDVVHMWGTGLLGEAAVRAARLLGVPSVITPFAHRGQWGDDATSALTYRRAGRVVALLQADARLYRELGVERGRVAVCGVCSPGVPAAGGDALRLRHGIDGPLVLFLGRRTPYKGADLVLAAARRLPEVTFVFAGPGARVVAPGGRVVDAGHVDEQERAAWLDAADLLCLPSAAEIFPSSMLEAWSVGTPAVTSDIEPLQELAATTGGSLAVVRDAEVLARALREAFAEQGRLRALGEAGRRAWRESFTPAAVAAAHEDLYDEVCGNEALAA